MERLKEHRWPVSIADLKCIDLSKKQLSLHSGPTIDLDRLEFTKGIDDHCMVIQIVPDDIQPSFP